MTMRGETGVAVRDGNAAGRRVLIVEDDTLVSMGLKTELQRLGHEVVAHAATAGEGLDLTRQHQPDVVLIDVRLADEDGLELAEQINQEGRRPMIIITAYSDKELIDRAGKAGVFGYLVKPISAESLAAQIEVAIQRFEEHERLLRENQELTQTLEARKLVERAKGIFMKRLGLSEPDAHRRLQQESQRRRVGMPELAKKIIESEELLGGP